MKGTKDSLLNSFFCIVGQTAGSKAQARTYRNTHECPTGGPTHIIPQFKALSLARQLHYKALSFLLLIEAMDKYYRLQAVKKTPWQLLRPIVASRSALFRHMYAPHKRAFYSFFI